MATRLGARVVAVALVGASFVLVGGGAPVVAADDAATCPAPGGGWSRLSGPDRYATAVAVGEETPGGIAYVASGDTFADAIAAGPVVGTGALLLVGRDTVPEPTRAELTALQPSRIVVVGGTNVVGPAVLATLRTFTRGTVVRIAGIDRYATAAALVAAGFPGRVDTVRLVAGATFADALAAGAAGAPLLLTGRDALPPSSAAQLGRLAPSTVEIAGGTAAVGTAVEDAVHAALPGATVRRIAGADRYQTAAALAVAAGTTGAATFLATGADFPDALAAIPAALRRRSPLLLLPPDGSIPSQVAAVVDARPTSDLVIVGGTSSVADDVIGRLRPATVACLLIDTAGLQADVPVPATVRLRAPAPPGGALVALSANDSGVRLPATITIAAGATTGTFSFAAPRSALVAGFAISASAGSSTRSVPVQVQGGGVQPTITSFASSATVLTSGQVVRLTWTTSDAAGCFLDNGVGSVPCNGGVTVAPGSTRTYTFTALNEGRTAVASATCTVGQRSRFLYVTHNNPTNQISTLSVDAATGQLSAIGAPLGTGGASDPNGIAVDPAGRYAYVALHGSDQIAMYTIDSTTGALTANGAVGAAGGPRPLVVDPSGRYVFVADQTGNTVRAFTIGATGQLTSNGGALSVGSQPVDIAIDPTGRYLYVLAVTGERVDEFTVDATGQLSANGTIPTGTGPRTIAVEPSGKYLYVSNLTSLDIQRYSLSSTGTLTSLGTTPMPGGAAPNGMAIGPDGRHLYAAYSNVAAASTWTIGSDGSLTFVDDEPTNSSSGWISVDSAGRYAYIPGGASVQQYSIDATTGALAQLAPATSATASNSFRLSGAR